MNKRKGISISFGLALVAVALGLTAVPANAQPILRGTFELPAAAYWGNTLLQPGQYTIRISTESSNLVHTPVIHLSGEGIEADFLAISTPAAESGRSHLDIADIGGAYVVRAFDAGSLGQSFAFAVTKKVGNKALRASAEPILPAMAVPVSGGGGL